MKENKKKPIFTFVFAAYADGSHNEKVVMEEGGENIAASVIYTLMNGQMASVVSELVQEQYPESYDEVNTQVAYLYEDFLKKAAELMKTAPQRPVVRATEVFGGKQE